MTPQEATLLYWGRKEVGVLSTHHSGSWTIPSATTSAKHPGLDSTLTAPPIPQFCLLPYEVEDDLEPPAFTSWVLQPHTQCASAGDWTQGFTCVRHCTCWTLPPALVSTFNMANYTPLKQTDGVIGFQLVACLWLPSAQSPTWSQLEQPLSHWEASSACPGISSNSSHELDWPSPSMYQTLKR